MSAASSVADVVDEKWEVAATHVVDSAPLPVSLLRSDDTGQPADAVELVKGANTELETAPLLVDLMWSAAEGADLQVAALLIGDDGRAYRDQPLVDQARPQGPDEAVHHVGHDRTERGWRDRLLVDLVAAPSRLSRVLVTAALDDTAPAAVTFGSVTGLEVVLGAPRAGGRPVRFVVPPLGAERAIVAVEIYRRGGRWRVRAVAQGYAEGVVGLARDFGRRARPGGNLIERSTIEVGDSTPHFPEAAMPVTRLNHAVLYVSDVARSVDFYSGVMGFEPINMLPKGFQGAAFLKAPGSTNDHDLGLFEVGSAAAPSRAGVGAVGLYHLAWEVDTLAELAGMADRLSEAGALVGRFRSRHDEEPVRQGS